MSMLSKHIGHGNISAILSDRGTIVFYNPLFAASKRRQ